MFTNSLYNPEPFERQQPEYSCKVCDSPIFSPGVCGFCLRLIKLAENDALKKESVELEDFND